MLAACVNHGFTCRFYARMNSSLVVKTLCTTRLLCVVLAIFGYRVTDTAECVTIQEYTGPDVVTSSQPLPPVEHLVSIDELCDHIDDSDVDFDPFVRQYVSPIQERGMITIRTLREANNGEANVAGSAHPGELSEVKVLEFIQSIIDQGLRENYPLLCMARQYMRSETDATSNFSATPPPSSTPTIESPDLDDASSTTSDGSDGYETADEGDFIDDSSETWSADGGYENRIVPYGETSTGWMDSLKRIYNTAKDYVTGSNKDPSKPVSSLGQRMKDIGNRVVKATARTAASMLVTISDKTGMSSAVASRLRDFFADIFGVDSMGEETNTPMPNTVSDESCFQEKLALLNAFYLNNTEPYPSKGTRYIFYGALPDSVDVAHAKSPFETVSCSSTSQYVIVSGGEHTPSYLTSILVSLFMP